VWLANAWLTIPPSEKAVAARTAAMAAISNPYSTADAPFSCRFLIGYPQLPAPALRLLLTAEQVLLNALLTSVPRPNTTATMTAAMAATMSPYSTAEAPRSRA
jgi:hypothetical protein